MTRISIVNGGLFTTIQDQGRRGYQQFGVPVSGVMDSFSHRIANILVGNDEQEAVLECTMMGPQIEFLDDCVIAITGGDLSPMLNRTEISMWKSHYVKRGDILSFGLLRSGCRSYIALAGGMDVPRIMESKSTYTKGQIGGYEGRHLKSGDIISLGQPKEKLVSLQGRETDLGYVPSYSNNIEVNVILGPQEDHFTQSGLETFLTTPYTVTKEFDRMGYRLEGEAIKHVKGGDIISDGIALGAIQVPSHGNPIIMMSDRQTIGGYTKIANVISTDLHKIAQAKPGDVITFRSVSISQAHQKLRDVENTIKCIKESCEKREIISTRNFNLKINGKNFQVKVEEIKTS